MIYIYNDLINAKIFTDVLDVLAYAHYYKVYSNKSKVYKAVGFFFLNIRMQDN